MKAAAKLKISGLHGWRPRIAGIGLCLAAAIFGCAHADEGVNAAADPMAVNIILTSDSTDVTKVGDFRVVSGYLSRSARVFRSASDKAHARFQPRLPLAGSYEVYVWWPQVATGAGSINASVRDARGSTRLALDQSAKGGQWNLLGVFEATAGKPIVLTLNAAPGQPVIVDAARFNRAGRRLPALEIEPQRLPAGEVNTDYRVELIANGRPPFVWAVAGGRPPEGIALDPVTGVLSGRAADAGRTEFTIEVRDATGRSTQRDLKLDMLEAEVSR